MTKVLPILVLTIGCVFGVAAEVPATDSAPAVEPAAEAVAPESVPAEPDCSAADTAGAADPFADAIFLQFSCPETGGCNTDFDCRQRNYFCPIGDVKTCFDSTGNCDGTCGCQG